MDMKEAEVMVGGFKTQAARQLLLGGTNLPFTVCPSDAQSTRLVHFLFVLFVLLPLLLRQLCLPQVMNITFHISGAL